MEIFQRIDKPEGDAVSSAMQQHELCLTYLHQFALAQTEGLRAVEMAGVSRQHKVNGLFWAAFTFFCDNKYDKALEYCVKGSMKWETNQELKSIHMWTSGIHLFEARCLALLGRTAASQSELKMAVDLLKPETANTRSVLLDAWLGYAANMRRAGREADAAWVEAQVKLARDGRAKL